MATTPIKFSKTLVSGIKGTYVLGPNMVFQRAMRIRPDWNLVRLGFIGSFTSTSGNNSLPNQESIIGAGNFPGASLDLLNTLITFGISNGVGLLGDTGNKFIGCVNWPNILPLTLRTDGTNWKMFQDTTGTSPPVFFGSVGNGYSFQFNATQTGQDWPSGNPTDTSNCFFAFGLELDIRIAGSLSISMAGNSSALSTASTLELTTFLNGTFGSPVTNTQVTGWWDGVTNFSDCQYLYMYFPFTNNRLRIHNMIILDKTV